MKTLTACLLALAALGLLTPPAVGQDFGDQQVITTEAKGARSVYATDLDGDGDVDVLSASYYDDKIAWYENLGGGSFGPQQVITTHANGASCVNAAELDGDGDADVLSASDEDDKIAWYENLGGGSFGPQQVITTLANGAQCVHATDLDGDGDADVLSASRWDDKIAWYENLGGGSFGAQQVISTQADRAQSVYAMDLDGDGDADVLSASLIDDKIAWSENLMEPPWIQSPVNGHWYRKIPPLDWHVAEYTVSQGWGGHLCTIRNQAENDWLRDTFVASQPIWIGYTDQSQEGVFEWSSGETPGFENWGTGQPDDAGGADWAVMAPVSGAWRDEPNLPARPSVVEVISDDCDGNQLPDVYQIALDPSSDWNGDRVLDVCSSANYCTAATNSTGVPASIGCSGSPLIASNALTLEAWDLPLFEYAYFLMSMRTGFVPGFGGSSGNLCLGPPIVRLNDPADGGAFLNTGQTGMVDLTLDLVNLPQGIKAQPGDTWYFQLWYRDYTTGPTSNTTDGIEVMFR